MGQETYFQGNGHPAAWEKFYGGKKFHDTDNFSGSFFD